MFIKKNYLCTKENTTEKCLINTVHVIYDTTRLPDIQSIGEQTVCLRCILQITVSKYCIDDLLYSKWLSTSGKIKGSRITVSPKTILKNVFELLFPKACILNPSTMRHVSWTETEHEAAVLTAPTWQTRLRRKSWASLWGRVNLTCHFKIPTKRDQKKKNPGAHQTLGLSNFSAITSNYTNLKESQTPLGSNDCRNWSTRKKYGRSIKKGDIS